MRLYAIKKPGSLLLMAFAYVRGGSWLRFLDNKPHHVYQDSPNTTFDEAVSAYEAIGYKCVVLECEEVILDGC